MKWTNHYPNVDLPQSLKPSATEGNMPIQSAFVPIKKAYIQIQGNRRQGQRR